MASEGERGLAEDPKWELALLATVQGFYQRLLGEHLGDEIPIPAELTPAAIGQAGDIRATLGRMHRWLQVLDMAATPAMLRLGMHPDLDPEAAEAVLRYFVRHRDNSAANRDKTDLIATFLYRHPRVPGQWERRGYGLDGSLPLSPYEIALIEILAESDAPVLPEQHVQFLREFGPLLDETQRFQDFNALMDSGIISRVRDLKASLGDSFYHPGVLATIAPYNAAFGARFDALFAAAAQEIKQFARTLAELGGSILSTVDGIEITVEDVAALNEAELLKVDYGAALEKFRRVSRLKKELERRPPIRPATPTARHAVAVAGPGPRRLPRRLRSRSLFRPPLPPRRSPSKRPNCVAWRSPSASLCVWLIPSSARSSPCVTSISCSAPTRSQPTPPVTLRKPAPAPMSPACCCASWP